MKQKSGPILMEEAYWRNSHLSIARFYGQISFEGGTYIIVNKEGKDIFQLSAEADAAGREKAIEPGEPADLLLSDFITLYKKLGRDRFIEILKEAPRSLSHEEMKERMKKEIKEQKPSK